MMSRRRSRLNDECDLNLTPMIDVVFLLLVFFVITTKPLNITGVLDANAANPGGGTPTVDQVMVEVRPNGYRLEGRSVTANQLDIALTGLALRSTAQRIMITSRPDAPHGCLVFVMDLCAKTGLKDVAIVRGR